MFECRSACFNLDEQALKKKIGFEPERFGLKANRQYKLSGAAFRAGSPYPPEVTIPARGHVLLEVSE